MLTVLRHSRSTSDRSLKGRPAFPKSPTSLSTHATGRGATLHIAKTLVHLGVRRALVPTFGPEGLIAPLVQSGLECQYYRLDPDLSPNLASIERLLRIPGGRAVVAVIHYFGYPKVSEELRGACSAAGAYVLEDFAQALLSCDEDGQPLSERATLSLFSLNKFLPVCEGAPAFSMTTEIQLGIEEEIRPTIPEQAISSYSDHLDAVARFVESPSANSKALTVSMAEIDLSYKRYYEHLHPLVTDWRSSDSQRFVPFPTFDYEGMALKRRSNAEIFYDTVDWNRWTSTEPVLPPGVIPFAIPLRVPSGRRESIIRALLQKGVWLGVLQHKWDFIPQGYEEDFHVESNFIAGHILVPVGEWIAADSIVDMSRALNVAAVAN